MGILKETAKILDKTAYVLNEAAFGDIRNIFNDNRFYDFMNRPIGLWRKDYGFMVNHLRRNIGNADHTYDGYGTPIGDMANPFYNTIVKVPWFYLDGFKNSTANYLEYIKAVYGAALSVENINNDDFLFHISDDASNVGYVDGRYAIEALVNDIDLIPNVNGTGSDTRLGFESGYYNRETLRNAVVANDKRDSYGFGITDSLSDYLGITTRNITENRTYMKTQSPLTGRFADGVFSNLEETDSPIESSNYGHWSDIGSYVGYYNSLTDKSRGYYEDNVYNRDRKYYPAILNSNSGQIKGRTYLGQVGLLIGHDILEYVPTIRNIENGLEAKSIDECQIRYVFSTLEEHSNISDAKNGGVYVYTEDEYGSSTDVTYASFNAGTRFGRYTSYSTGLTANDLLKKTNDSFKKGKYNTIIARFHTNPQDNTDTTQTAISNIYGMSHGRNLLKLNPDTSEGYDNPYCRVWTFHHQYHRLADAIRPLGYDAQELYDKYNFNTFTADHSDKGFPNGRIRLEKYGSLNKNGLVNITPVDPLKNTGKKVDIRNCMFSIENLAWKDAFSTDQKSRQSFQTGGLSAEQKGPFGGRIMWFPPYDLKFNEDVSVNWNETNFIGRGEGIYTYANTVRTGSLTFKLLVDHPSIIDYWENRGKSVSDSVDDKDDPEQELLRFFAGCDMLSSKPAPTPEPIPATKDEAIPSPGAKSIKFFVFYPNNYSGIDDDVDFAMKYLTNGLGAGKVEGGTDYRIPYAKADNGFGGYEMRPGKPVSIVRSQTDGDPHIANVTVGNTSVSLYVQEGDSTNKWWQRKWYYRVDKKYKNQLLQKPCYVDTASYCLNSNAGRDSVINKFGVEDVDNLYSFADIYAAIEGGDAESILRSDSLVDESRVTRLKSLLTGTAIKNIKSITCVGHASNQGHSTLNNKLRLDRANTIKKWLVTKGFDSNIIKPSAGDVGGNDVGINKGDESDMSNKIWRSVEVTISIKSEETKTVQEAQRESNTILEGEQHQVNYLNTPLSMTSDSTNLGIERIKVFNDLSANKMVESAILKDRATSIRLNNLSDNINGLAMNLRSSVHHGNVNVNSIVGSIAEFSEHYKHYQYDDLGFITNYDRGKSDYEYSYNQMHDNPAHDEVAGLNDTLEDKTETSVRQGTNNNKVTRYDNEAKFFTMLEKEEPFLHQKISDKIKYFDPAFHSISPEGFNARLTFLHQCTRQGPTVGSSDNYTAENTANNLAFGRPPVCILRLGDFYYTKILIDGLTINFDPLLWDLNTEGIGVMPMIADITIRFRFIGGSSLAGHISRLQNALSFNYYANTEVYDNRSELAEYDDNGNISRLGTLNITNKSE